MEFENLNLTRSKLPYNKHSDPHSCRDTTDRIKMKTVLWVGISLLLLISQELVHIFRVCI
jgi:hypothetical protein